MTIKPYLIVINDDNQKKKMCKIDFTKDGSVQVFMPYHQANEGILIKLKYKKWGDGDVGYEDATQISSYKKTKLIHHKSGFIQFSGPGIISGLENGIPKGLGVFSRPLDKPHFSGPMILCSAWGLAEFENYHAAKQAEEVIIFQGNEIWNGRGVSGNAKKTYLLEVFCLDNRFRDQIYENNGKYQISLRMPNGTIIPQVILKEYLELNVGNFFCINVSKCNLIQFDSDSGYQTSSARDNDGNCLFAIFPWDKEKLSKMSNLNIM